MFLRIVALLFGLTMLPGFLLLVIGYLGPGAFLVILGLLIAIPASRLRDREEHDDKTGWRRMEEALERYLEEVKD